MKLIDQVNQIKKDARLALIKKLAGKDLKVTYRHAMKSIDDNAPSIATENATKDLAFEREQDAFTTDLNDRLFG